MNRARRAMIAKASALMSQAHDILDEVKSGEEGAFDNMPESLQESERGEQMEENVYNLDEMVSTLEEMLEGLEDM